MLSSLLSQTECNYPTVGNAAAVRCFAHSVFASQRAEKFSLLLHRIKAARIAHSTQKLNLFQDAMHERVTSVLKRYARCCCCRCCNIFTRIEFQFHIVVPCLRFTPASHKNTSRVQPDVRTRQTRVFCVQSNPACI